MNPNPNLSNLKPFKKGQSGNPAGRPKDINLKEVAIKILSDDKNGKIALEEILTALLAKAVKGDVKAAQELLDRAFGKAKQSIEHEGKAFENVTIQFIKADGQQDIQD